jgi:HAE1 family hydrophobic/amphiphilic exporter-1
VTQAQSDLRTRQIEQAKLLDTIALEVRDAGNAVKESAEIVQALTGTVRQAVRLLEMAEKGFEFGVKIRLEVDDAQLNLLQARSNLARARRDYQVARVNYEWAMGIAGE